MSEIHNEGMIIQKRGEAITTLDEWRHLAPPKDETRHWKDGRSAKEAATAWLASAGCFPKEILDLFQTNTQFRELTIERIEPEVSIKFDEERGPRNADIAVWAHGVSGPVAITVEAKADEPFDDLVCDVFAKSLERLINNPRSGGVRRIVDLAQSLFGVAGKGRTRVDRLRYQLLTASAGTLALAKSMQANRAVLIVHEFVTSRTSKKKLELNASDYAAFVRRISNGTVTDAVSGVLYGPLVLPAEPLFDKQISFFIGKATRKLDEPGV